MIGNVTTSRVTLKVDLVPHSRRCPVHREGVRRSGVGQGGQMDIYIQEMADSKLLHGFSGSHTDPLGQIVTDPMDL